MPAALLKREPKPDPATVEAMPLSPVEDRRGAMRPGRLVSSRARIAGQMLSAAFRVADLFALALVALWIEAGAGHAWSLLGLWPFAAASALVAAAMNLAGAYGFRGRETLGKHALRLIVAFTSATCAFVLATADHVGLVGLWLGSSFCVLFLLHMAEFSLVAHLRKAGKLTPNVVIVGGGANAERLIRAALDSRDVNILGLFDDRADRAAPILGVPILGDTAMLLSHRVLPFVDRIVITVPSAAEARVRQIIDRVSILPNSVTLFIDDGLPLEGAHIAHLVDQPLALVSGQADNHLRTAIKRAQDLVIGSLALLLALPIMALVALAVRLDSPGPIFFRQRRHGFNNEEIVVWKFRSMRVESADAKAARQVQADDDRVTRVGRFIRRTSFDELPQILNVLTGEMSLVGPRPHAIGMMTGDVESSKLVAEYAHRHRMKPGITGWAAIKGSRGAVDTPELVRRRVALDVEYIERQSFWLDLYIMVMTLPCLLGDSETVR